MQRDAEGRLAIDSAEMEQRSPSGRSLWERLDAEILPRLERPGRSLGPFVLGAATLDSEAVEGVAIWTSSTGPQLDDLATRLTQVTPSPLAWLTPPSPDLVAALRSRDLPWFTRPGGHPLAAHRVLLVLLEDPLEIFDYFQMLANCPADQARPLYVGVGPALADLGDTLTPYVDWMVGGATPDAVLRALGAAIGSAEVDRDDLRSCLLELGRQPGVCVREGALVPTAWPSQASVGSTPKGRPTHSKDRVLGPTDLKSAGLRSAPLGEGGHCIEAWLCSASRTRRTDLGIGWDDADSLALEAALSEEFVPLTVHLAVGLPAEDGSDLAAAKELFADLRRTLGPDRRVEAQLHTYWDPERECADPQDLRRWADACEGFAKEQRVRVGQPRELLGWIHAAFSTLGSGLDPALRRVFASGAVTAQSKLATDPVLWHKSMQEAELKPPATATWFAARVPPANPGSSLHGLHFSAPAVGGARSPADEGTGDSRRWQKWKALVPRKFDHRVVFRNRGRMRFLSQGELGAIVARLCRERDLPLATTGTVQPKLRMSFGPWLAVGIEGVQEYLDLSFRRKVADLQARLSEGLPAGFEILAVHSIPPSQPQLALSRVALAEYEVSLGSGGTQNRNVLSPLATRTLVSRVDSLRERAAARGETTIEDLHHQLHDVRLSTEDDAAACLAFRLDLVDPGPKRKPHDFLGLLLGDLVEDARILPIRRTGLYFRDESTGAPQWRTPSEVLERANHRIRKAEKTCA